MASVLRPQVVALLFLLGAAAAGLAAATWCVARSDASDQALQSALDYACWAGADCAPLQSSGLCFLPNTLQAHASYAFNSFYQRKGNAPGSCAFAGTATVAKTDPSYGSCVYPSSPSTAGGTIAGGGTSTPAGTNTTPGGGTTITTLPPPPPGTTSPFYGNGGGGSTPGMGPVIPDSDNSNPITTCFHHAAFLLVFMFIFQIL